MNASVRDVACRELVEMLTDYLDGALPPGEAAAVDAHLAVCEPCRDYLDQLRATIATLGSVPVDTIAPSMSDEVLREFRRVRGTGDPG